MAISLEQFVKALGDSGLMSDEDFERFRSALPLQAHGRDAAAAAKQLVADGKLTQYQAAALYQGKAQHLVLGNYVAVEQLGAGGMGQVFKARHRRMDRMVAVKILSSKAVESPAAVKRFHREVKAAARLDHPNIVTAHDADEQNGVHFLVMEYVDGPDLASMLRTQGPLDVEQAVDYVKQAARGLAYAHEHDVIHRDIKPENLLVANSGTPPRSPLGKGGEGAKDWGTVKILDMGLARIDQDISQADSAENHDLTQAGQIMGTINYMPPEQALDTRMADARSDIYSLGCTLYRLLTGNVMYEGDTKMKKLVAHREAPIPSLRSARRDVPELLDAVFAKMVAKRSDDRYQSMHAVIDALEAAVTGLRAPPAPPQPDQETALAGPPLPGQERSLPQPPMPSQETALSGPSSGDAKISAVVPPPPHGNSHHVVPPPPAPPAAAPPVGIDTSYAFAPDESDSKYFVQPWTKPPLNAEVIRASLPEAEVAGPPPVPTFAGSDTISSQRDQDTSTNTSIFELEREHQGRWLVSLFLTAMLTMVVVVGLVLAVMYLRDDPDLIDHDSVPEVQHRPTEIWLDAISAIQLPEDCLGGKWNRQGNELFAPGGDGCRATIPIMPTGSYKLEVEFTRLRGTGGIHVMLPAGQGNTMLVLVDESGKYGGLQRVSGRDLQVSGDARRDAANITDGRRYRLEVTVQLHGSDVEIRSWLDGSPFVTWRGPQTALSDPGGNWNLPARETLGLGSPAETLFHVVQLHMLSGNAQPGLGKPRSS